MPELPEVETIARDLNAAGVVGRTVACGRVFWARSMAEPSPATFCRRIENKKVAAVRRRGKFLVLRFYRAATGLLDAPAHVRPAAPGARPAWSG